MPNHVINEIIFRNVDQDAQRRLLEKLCNEKGEVDFEILLPTPVNAWRGGVRSRHSEKLPPNCLDWCAANWSTKWNAYDHHPNEATENSLTLRFQTAWRTPYGWLVAVLNTFETPFTCNWLSEGGWAGHSDEWRYGTPAVPFSNYEWIETEIAEGTELHRHLHKLLWGVEEFEPEAAQ